MHLELNSMMEMSQQSLNRLNQFCRPVAILWTSTLLLFSNAAMSIE